MDDTVPEEIRQVGIDAVSTFRKSRRRGTFVSNLIRVMFVGHFGVGKTTLVKGILGQDNKDTESTNGIDVHLGKFYYNEKTQHWIVQDKHTEFVLSLDDIIQIDFWDFAGQLIFYTTHQTYFSRRSVYFLVFDLSLGLHGEVKDEDLSPVRKDRRQVIDFLEFWIGSIRLYAPGQKKGYPKIVLVGTHKDKLEDVGELSKIREEICQKFACVINSGQLIVKDDLFINALDMSEEQINLLRGIILEVGKSYPEFGESIPASWMEIHKILNSIKDSGRKIIFTDELLAINKGLKVPLDKFELQLFLLYLHNVGYILYFKDRILRDNIILDPRILIDAMKSFITCEQFVTNLLDRITFDFQNMRKTGRVKRSFIEKVWRIVDNDLFFKNREHLFLTMEKLDLLCRPKLYDKDGNVCVPDFFFVPCMVVSEVPKDLPEVPLQDDSIVVTYTFKDILPPAVFNRVISSCLSLWPIYKGHMYNGQVLMRSGRFHILNFKREFRHISVTFLHTQTQEDIDINFCRAIRQFVSQAITSVVATYSGSSSRAYSTVYQIEYNAVAIEKQLHVGDERGNAGKSRDVCPVLCQGPSPTELQQKVSDLVLMRIARQIPSDDLIPLSTNVTDVARKLQRRETGYFQPEGDTVKEMTADFPELRQSDLAFLILHKWKEIVIACGGQPTVEELLACLRPEFSHHLVCRALHQEDHVASHLDPVYQMKEPSKELLDAVADRISTTYLHVGLELDFHCDEVLRFRMNYRTNTIEIIREILYKWYDRNRRRSKRPTIAWLATALLNTDTNIQGIVELEYKDDTEGSKCLVM